MPENWFDEDGNHCILLSVIEDEGRNIVAYKYKNGHHRWEYKIAPESHIVFPDSQSKTSK